MTPCGGRAQRHKRKLLRAEQHQIPGQPANFLQCLPAHAEHLEFVAAPGGLHLHGVLLHAVKAQLLGHPFPVQRQRHAISRGGAQGGRVDPLARQLREVRDVAEAFGKRAHPQVHARRHGPLQMGVPRHGGAGVRFGEVLGGLLGVGGQGPHFPQVVQHEQPQRDGHLVVAGSAQVDALAQLAQVLGEVGLDRGVAVFKTIVQHERRFESARPNRGSASATRSTSASSIKSIRPNPRTCASVARMS